jgi:CDP-diacylglycerol--serine O-phosphatidyltransferase
MENQDQDKPAEEERDSAPGVTAPLEILVDEHEEEVSENGESVRRQGI